MKGLDYTDGVVASFTQSGQHPLGARDRGRERYGNAQSRLRESDLQVGSDHAEVLHETWGESKVFRRDERAEQINRRPCRIMSTAAER